MGQERPLTKVRWTSCWYYLTLGIMSKEVKVEAEMAHICASLEDDGLMTRPFGVSKCTDSLSGFVRVGDQEVIKSFMTKCIQKPFAAAS